MSGSMDLEKIDAAEAEARKRRQRLLQRKTKRQDNGDNSNEEDKNDSKNENTPSTEVDSILENQKKQPESDELDLSNLAPRKIDWDLKRGIAKSLEILQERTNEVIAEILLERSEIKEEND